MEESPLQTLIEEGIRVAASADNRNHQTHPYFPPSDEPLGWQTTGRCVRLDVAIYALHIFAARVAFRSFTTLVRQKKDTLKAQLVRLAASFLAGKIAGQFFAPIYSNFNVWKSQFDAEEEQKQIESAIRRQSLKAQRELFQNALGKSKRQRKTRQVMSRHKTPYQRKPNKSWKP